MNKFNTLKLVGYNWLNAIKFNAQYDSKLVELLTRIGPRPIVLDENKNQIDILDHSFNVVLQQTVGSVDNLSFSIPLGDSKRSLLQSEGFIQMFDDIYVIREVTDKKKDSATNVYCEAIWYDLQDSEPFDSKNWTGVTAASMMNDVLSGTGWSVGNVSFTNTMDFAVTDVTEDRLAILGNIEKQFGGELWFDTQAKTISLLTSAGFDTGALIMYDKNADDIQAYYDTRSLCTKLYFYGANNLTIADANNGVPYLEDYSYTKTKRVTVLKNENYTNPYQLKDAAHHALDIMSKPICGYSVSISDIESPIGLEHEKFALGGVVNVYDKELNLNVRTRILSWQYNVIEPEKTQLSLNSVEPTLSDLLSGSTDLATTMSSADTVNQAQMLDLSVYNYLLNSRADDDFSYWQNTGWEIDTANGKTGNSSFLASSTKFGQNKSLSQTVYPSSSDNYAISFQASSDSIVAGANKKIGVNITITYDDGSQETKFITLV